MLAEVDEEVRLPLVSRVDSMGRPTRALARSTPPPRRPPTSRPGGGPSLTPILAAPPPSQLLAVKPQFDAFIAKYEKALHYASNPAEYVKRLGIFARNLVLAAERQAQDGGSAEHGVTEAPTSPRGVCRAIPRLVHLRR